MVRGSRPGCNRSLRRIHEVLLEPGHHVGPPGIRFDGTDLEVDLLLRIEEFIDALVGSDASERI